MVNISYKNRLANKFKPNTLLVFIFLLVQFGFFSFFIKAQSNNPEILLSKVIPLLEVRFDIKFGYDPEVIKPLSLNKKILTAENIHNALQIISAALPLEYNQALDGQILLRKRTEVKEEILVDD